MIVAAGLSPAWQHLLVLDDFLPGEVNRARQSCWVASGKAINAGIALSRLGGPCTIVSVLGGPAREEIEAEIDDLGIATRWITTATATRTCTTIVNSSNGVATEVVENAPALSAQELSEAQRVIAVEAEKADAVILAGTLPAGAPAMYYRDLLRQIRCRAILDFRGEELLAALEEKPFLAKPNRQELSQTVGRPLNDDADLRSAMQEICQRGAQWVVITDGPRPVWVTDGKQFWRMTPPPPSTLVNPIACGDCLAAGIAWSLRAGREPLEAIRFGVAAAVDNAGTLLPARLDQGRIATLLPGVTVVSA